MAAVAGDCMRKREAGKPEGEFELAVAVVAWDPAGSSRYIACAAEWRFGVEY